MYDMISNIGIGPSKKDPKPSSLCIDLTDVFKESQMTQTGLSNKNVLAPRDLNPKSDSIPSASVPIKNSSNSSIRKRFERRSEEKVKQVSFDKVVPVVQEKSLNNDDNHDRKSLSQHSIKQKYARASLKQDDVDVDADVNTSDRKFTHNTFMNHTLERRGSCSEQEKSSKISVRQRLEDRAKEKARQLSFERENYDFNILVPSLESQPNDSENDYLSELNQFVSGRKKTSNVNIVNYDNVDDRTAEQGNAGSQTYSWNLTNDAGVEKQCQVFSCWLNHILKPTTDLQLEFQHALNVSLSTRKQAILVQQLEKARRNANILFCSSEFLHIRSAVAAEISRGALAIRSDYDVFADVGLRNQMLDLLLSFSPAWLRLGLETIYQHKLSMRDLLNSFYNQCNSRQLLGLLPLESQKPSIKKLLRKFLSDRLLNDPDIHYKFTGGKCLIPSGKFEVDYKRELYSTALQRILNLVIFLNHAKINNIIESYPVLFNKDSKVKSTKEFLRILSLDYLRGEGNLLKHLAGLGITTLYQQNYIDEIDYAVKNLAVDLRDGVRLVKLASVLSGDEESAVLSKLRVPANSRLQKLHNVEIALTIFRDLGIPKMASIHARHIVDGHRVKVLEMLWLIMIHFKMPSLLSPRNKTDDKNRSKGCASNQKSYSDATTELISKFSDGDELCQLLLEFCNETCKQYGCCVDNFSTCFTDGKVLCLIIHHYFPHLLTMEQILPTSKDLSVAESTNSAAQAKAMNNEQMNRSLVLKCANDIGDFPKLFGSCDATTFTDERSVIIFLAYLCSIINPATSTKVPATPTHSNNDKLQPDEESISVIACINESPATAPLTEETLEGTCMLTTLMLTEISPSWKNIDYVHNSAACLIQKIFRSWRHCKSVTISKNVCKPEYFRLIEAEKNHAAIIIQSNFRGYFSRQNIQLSLFNAVITIIQSVYRGWSVRKSYARIRYSIVLIQRLWRRAQCREQSRLVELIYSSALSIQTCYRRWKAMQMYAYHKTQLSTKQRQNHPRKLIILIKSLAAIKIQSFFRARAVRLKFLLMRSASKCIQTIYRRSRAQLHYHSKRMSVVTIQKIWRGFAARLQYCYDLSDIVFVQSLVRRNLARRNVDRIRQNILLIEYAKNREVSSQMIQSLWKGFSLRKLLLLKRHAVRTIQLWYRQRKQARVRLALTHRSKQAAIVLQRFYYVCYILRRQQRAALIIQTFWRGYTKRVDFIITVFAAVKIQTAFRRYRPPNTHSVVIQYPYEAVGAVTDKTDDNWSYFTMQAEKIQSVARSYLTRKKFLIVMQSIICIQSAARGRSTRRKSSQPVKNAALRILQKNLQWTHGMTMGERTKDALTKITESSKLIEIMQSLRTLEICTRLSRECCAAFIVHGAHYSLCNFMKSCNRSLPHTELLEICLVVFMHISRNIDAADFFATVDFVDMLIDLVQMFRDKESIFCIACIILRHFIHHNKTFKLLCSRSESKKRLYGVFKLNMKRIQDKREKSITLRSALDALRDILSLI